MLKLKPWSTRGQSAVLVARSDVGMLVIAGRDPWARFKRLLPYDCVLQAAAASLRPALTMPGLNGEELMKVARTLRDHLPDAVWPLRGVLPPGTVLGLVRDGEVVAEGPTIYAMGRQLGLTRGTCEALRLGWLSGERTQGLELVARAARVVADLSAFRGELRPNAHGRAHI